jgi:hypothetical protein
MWKVMGEVRGTLFSEERKSTFLLESFHASPSRPWLQWLETVARGRCRRILLF